MSVYDSQLGTPLNPDRDGGATVRNLVGGEWQAPSGDDHPVGDPGTGEQLGTVGFSTAGDVDEVVATATDAFADWRQQPVEERIQPLFRFKTLLEEHQEALAHTLSREHGKTLSEARGELRD